MRETFRGRNKKDQAANADERSVGQRRSRGPWRIAAWAFVASALIVGIFHDLIFQKPALHESMVGKALPSVVLQDSNDQAQPLYALIESFEEPRVLISFWATWCLPCVRELPHFQSELSWLSGRGVGLLLVNYDGSNAEVVAPKVKQWLEKENLNLETFFDFNSELLAAFGAHSLPFHVLVDADTKEALWFHRGEMHLKQHF